MSTTEQSGTTADLAARLGQVRVGLRQDLEVTRHLFRGQPSYVVRDPVTFQSHRLDPADYQVFVSIEASRPLAEILADLVERGLIAAEDQEAFYEFIVQLHRLNFLNLPISDEKQLYKRYLARQQARRKEKLMGFLFLRIPLVNPDAFLERTIRYGRVLFSRCFFMVWLLVVGTAAVVGLQNWDRFLEPLQGVLATENLPLIWLVLIGLKVFHELGHAYACKYFGGYVPEMGAYLLVFTPCAYVDATSAWGFTRRRDRLIVCLAGMYVESFIAAIAVFVWAATGPSLLHSLAYNVIFLAGVVTILFNVNPLMRYDGYYVLSDMVEIPNLRARSTKYVVALLKRVFLGVPLGSSPGGWRLRAILFSYGLAASVYRTVLLFTIAALVASKMFILGMVLAAVYFGTTLWGMLRRFVQYLWRAQETARVRGRAMALGVVVLAVLPGAVFLLPVRSKVCAAGFVTTEQEKVVRARMAGFVQQTPAKCGQQVQPGEVLVVLSNDAVEEELAEAAAAVQASEIRRDAYRVDQPARLQQEEENLKVYRMDRHRRRAEMADLVVVAPAGGKVISCLREIDTGRFVREGEALATVASGRWQVRAVLDEQQMLDSRPAVGDRVEFRAAPWACATLRGRIRTIVPAGTRTIETPALTHLGGGNIAVDPLTGEASQPYFELTIDLAAGSEESLRHGMTGRVRLRGQTEPIGFGLVRGLIRFTNSLMQS